jgi:hypothetical protein
MATSGNPYDPRSEDRAERQLAKQWDQQQNNPLQIWDRENVVFSAANPYDSRSEDPTERAAASQAAQQQGQAFAQHYGLDYTPSGSPAAGLMPDGRGMAQARQWEDFVNRWSSNKDPTLPTLNMTPEQKQTFIKQVYSNPGADATQFLTPEQQQVAKTMMTFYDQHAGFDGFQKALMAGAISGFGALAGPSLFGGAGAAETGAGIADAAWGVNPASTGAAGEFSLAGGTASGSGGLGLSTTSGSGLGLAGGTGATTTAGLGLAGGAGSLLTPAITGGATGLPAAAGGGGFFEGFGDFVKSAFMPTDGKNPFTLKDLAGVGLNYFTNKSAANDLEGAANTALQAGNPLSDPRRQPYQQQLAELLQNPTAFYDTNPVVKAQLDLARRQFEANSAKMGVGGTQSSAYLKNMQNNAATTFNDQAKLLSELGGFTFPGGGGTNAFMTGSAGAAGANQNATSMFADIGQRLFGNTDLGKTPVTELGKKFDFSLG